MSLRLNCLIEITQVPNSVYSARNKVFQMDFVNSCDISSSWQNLTDTAKLKFPRTIYVEDENGKLYNWSDQDIYGTSGTKPPIMMRGDKISIALGYWVQDENGEEELNRNVLFTGYIARIKNRMPIEIECEDEMWLLKQINAPNKLFKGSEYTVQKMVAELLDGTGIKVVDGTDASVKTNIGDFRTQNETVAQVLERLRKDGGLYSYFRDGELRCSGIVYYPQDRKEEVFEFQENIINDSLEYRRKEDLMIAVKAHAEFLSEEVGSNADGTPKSKRKRLEIMVGTKGNGVIGEIGDPRTFHGDIISFPVIGATDKEYMLKKATEYLSKFYYTGFSGGFTTFGIPTVRHGDGAIIRDKKIPERNGTYLIKAVNTSFGISGFRQKPLLHLRIDQGYTQDQLNAGI